MARLEAEKWLWKSFLNKRRDRAAIDPEFSPSGRHTELGHNLGKREHLIHSLTLLFIAKLAGQGWFGERRTQTHRRIE